MVSASDESDPLSAGTFWMFDLDGLLPVQLKPRPAAQFGRVDSEAVSSLVRAMGLDDAVLVLERFARQRRCYGAWVEGTLVAYGWVTFDEEWIGELSLRIRLAPGEAYIWDCATLPAYRGQHLYPALLTYISSELRAEGFRRALIGADGDNLASQRGMLLAGFQPVADMFETPALTKRQMWLIGRPGVPEPLVQHIRQALSGAEIG